MSGNNAYKARKAAIGGAYSLFPGSGAGCQYCGIPADTYDHVPALSKVYSLGVSEFEKKKIRLWIVPACNECNSKKQLLVPVEWEEYLQQLATRVAD